MNSVIGYGSAPDAFSLPMCSHGVEQLGMSNEEHHSLSVNVMHPYTRPMETQTAEQEWPAFAYHWGAIHRDAVNTKTIALYTMLAVRAATDEAPPAMNDARLYMNIAIKLQACVDVGLQVFVSEMSRENGGTSLIAKQCHKDVMQIRTNRGLVQYLIAHSKCNCAAAMLCFTDDRPCCDTCFLTNLDGKSFVCSRCKGPHYTAALYAKRKIGKSTDPTVRRESRPRRCLSRWSNM